MRRDIHTQLKALGSALGLLLAVALSGQASAADLRPGGKLLLTRGVTQAEGAGGGGLAPWALITGNETRDGTAARRSRRSPSCPTIV